VVTEERVDQWLDDLDHGTLDDPVVDALEDKGTLPVARDLRDPFHPLGTGHVFPPTDRVAKLSAEFPPVVLVREIAVTETVRTRCLPTVQPEMVEGGADRAFVGDPAKEARGNGFAGGFPFTGHSSCLSTVTLDEIAVVATMLIDPARVEDVGRLAREQTGQAVVIRHTASVRMIVGEMKAGQKQL